MIKSHSYTETLKNLSNYNKALASEICQMMNFPQVSNTLIGLRKNVEIGFYANVLTPWEYQAVFIYGKSHMYQEYYPVLTDLIKNISVPRKSKDYGCNINYHFFFPPAFHEKNFIYSFSVTFFEKPIFKHFNSHQSSLEQDLVTEFSSFFRKQNKYGPEKISVAIIDDQFVTIMISGILTPFMGKLANLSAECSSFLKTIFTLEMKEGIDQIFPKYFDTVPCETFIHLDIEADKLISLTVLVPDTWTSLLAPTSKVGCDSAKASSIKPI